MALCYTIVSHTKGQSTNVWSINRTVIAMGFSYRGSNYNSTINRRRSTMFGQYSSLHGSAEILHQETIGWSRSEEGLKYHFHVSRVSDDAFVFKICDTVIAAQARPSQRTNAVSRCQQDEQQKLFHVSTVLLHQTLGDVGDFLQGMWIKLPWLTLLYCVWRRECHKRSPRV